jgi:predicted Rossmann fold nucleotide-binding protein DprA/Smf involved in DNA uptake
MTRRPDASLVSLLLTQRLVDAGQTPLKASEYWQILELVADLGELLGADVAALRSRHGLAEGLAERIEGLLSAATTFAFELENLEQQGMRLVGPIDDEYPAVLTTRLGRSAPPLLYVIGEPALLTRDLLGVVGSRDVSPEVADAAMSAGAHAVSNGWGVVSGGAKGVDRLAMEGALSAGGVAVGVLADSLIRMARDPEVRRAVTDGALCLCSPYKPTAGFSVANAMGRNKLIYALSQATLVVTSAEGSGGTWAGAEEALKKRYAPVLVWENDAAGPGNAALMAKGAVAVGDLAELVGVAAGQLAANPSDAADQLRLTL